MKCDSSAAKAGAERPGLLHVRHMQLRDLFLKDLVGRGILSITKIGTKENISDVLTKTPNYCVWVAFWKLVEKFWRFVRS
jgi:hypothetical protein